MGIPNARSTFHKSGGPCRCPPQSRYRSWWVARRRH